MSQAYRRAEVSPFLVPPTPPTPVAVAANLLSGVGLVLFVLRLGLVVAAGGGWPAGPYLVGAVLGAVISSLIPILLARHLRLGQRRFRRWTMVLVVMASLFCLVEVGVAASPLSLVGGVTGLLVCVALVVLLCQPASNRWFARP